MWTLSDLLVITNEQCRLLLYLFVSSKLVYLFPDPSYPTSRSNRMINKYNSILLYILALSLTAWCGSAPAQTLKLGDEAPNFTLQDLSGATYTLSDFRGKVVLINFFGYN